MIKKIYVLFVIFFSLCTLESKEEFVFLSGDRRENMTKKYFSLMTWNICALTRNYPIIYGGVRPAKKRIDEIVDFILEADPDILCLQESHDKIVSNLLYEKLQKNYEYFVIHIGKDSLIQFNSGLFIASKFPIEDLSFTPFNNKGRQKSIKKGFFCFKAMSDEKPLAYIITTHLQPYKTVKDEEIRLRELKLIHNKLLQNIELDSRKYLRIVCGDLNIDRLTPEDISTNFVQSYFIDSLRSSFSDKPLATCTNYLTYYSNTLNPVPPDQFTEIDESIDYCLILKNDCVTTFNSKILEAFDKMKPKQAISDHHAIFTQFLIVD